MKILLKSTLLMVLTLFGCSDTEFEKKAMINDKASITIKIYDLKYDESANKTLVYGNMIINSKIKMGIIDLNCIQLSYKEGISDKIYVNSVAHILTNQYIVDSSVLEESVYWSFNGKIPVDIESINIEIDKFCEFLKN